MDNWVVFDGGINTQDMVIKTPEHGANISIWCRLHSSE